MKRSPYPLQWPENTPRTSPEARRSSKFGQKRNGQVSPYEAAKDVHRELDRMVGTSFVSITSMLPTRHDGLPYSDGRVDQPGVAVWFVHHGHERVLACDAWSTPGENMRAIALTLDALRGMERWGVAEAVERAFAGFAALPAGGDTAPEQPPAPKKRPWREVIGGAWPELEPAELLVLAKARHRRAIATAHPDAGGDHDRAAELNAALAEAEQELAP